jgi:hypothetical protein
VTVKPCYDVWSRYSEVEGKGQSLEISTCAGKNKGNILSTGSGVCAIVVPRVPCPAVFELSLVFSRSNKR